MVDFSEYEEVKAWLESIEPAERRREAAVALAARAALRVAPLLRGELNQGKSGHTQAAPLSDIVLPCLRATALAWAAARYPAQGKELRAAAVAADAVSATINGPLLGHAVTFALAAAAGAGAAATDAAATDVAAAASTISSASDAAATAAANSVFTANAATDVAFIDSGQPAADLAGLPLWQSAPPAWASDAWRRLKAALLAADEGWEVWIDWYEARLAGDAAHARNETTLEIDRATIPDEIWNQGPTVVNAEIKRLIALHSADEATIEIRGAQRLADWLAEQDDGKRNTFAVIVAARAALRAFPTTSAWFGDSSFPNASAMVLSVVRCLALPWFGIGHVAPDDFLGRVDAAADHSAPSATIRDKLGLRAVTSSAAAFFAADAYAFALRAPQPNDVRGDAKSRAIVTAASQAVENAVGAYTSVGATDPLDFWSAISADVKALAAGRSPRSLSRSPLWPGQGAPYEASAQWSTLMTKLRATDEDWSVWFDWYQRRIEGARPLQVGDGIERVYVDVPTRLWKEGPTQVNRWIKDRIAELLDQPRAPEPTAPHSAPPEIPPPKPAALEPVFRAGPNPAQDNR